MFKSGLQIGKLNDSAYASWELYIQRCGERLGMPNLAEIGDAEGELEGEVGGGRLRRRLEFLHVLRCMIGSVLESLFLMDRWMMLRDGLNDDVEVKMVNVFDQSTGSARNVALVVEI